MITLELHAHSYASSDSLLRPADIVRVCRRKGIDRIAITDHNTMRGALELRDLAPELVIMGEEIMTTQGELLAYFIKEEVPRGLSPAETIARLRAQGAVISVAHPFDRLRSGAWREPDLAAILPLVDALEVFNARCIYPADNQRALVFAKEHAKLGTVGSDAHCGMEVGYAVQRLPSAASADTAADFLAGLAQSESATRLSSPLIHFVSAFAKQRRKMARRISRQKG